MISTGPYSIVRHPLYSAVLIMLPSTALMLGSWYGVAASFLITWPSSSGPGWKTAS